MMIGFAILLLQAAPLAPTATPDAASSPTRVREGTPSGIVLRGSRARTVPRNAPPPRLRSVAKATRAATVEPGPHGFVNAIQIYAYAEGLVYQIYTRPGRVTDIALQPGERLISVASGDTVRWIIGDTTSGAASEQRTHILIKPSASGLATNLVVTTDRRTYYLAASSNDGPAMAGLSWRYPSDALLALARTDHRVTTASVPPAPVLERLRFDYAITGDRPVWRPLRAFDDGRQTFIEFPPSLGVGEAPPLFLVDGNDEPQLVNYRLQGRFYVVDRLFEAAELRFGTKRQSVVRIERRVRDAGRSGS